MIELPPPLWLPPRPAIIRPADRGLVKASFLPGMFPAGAIAAAAVAPAASISYVGSVTDIANAASYTFGSAPVGAAAAGRKVIVGCLIRGVATVLTATYAGSAMTQLGFLDATNASFAIFAINEAAATTATIVITGSGSTMTASRIWIWNGFNCASAPHSVGSQALGAVSGADFVWTTSLNCPARSVVAGVTSYVDAIVAGPNTVWSPLTEREDSSIESTIAMASAADTTLAAANPALGITARVAIGGGPNGGGLLAVCL